MHIDLAPDLSIRNFLTTDVEDIVEHANDSRVVATLANKFPHPYTLQDARDWIKKCQSERPARNFAIARSGQLIGGIGLMPKSDVYRVGVELGYWLGHAYWGQGIMSRAVQAMTPWIFAEQPGIQRLQARVYSNNPASARVLEKAGFAREACLRRAVIKKERLLDLWIYARLR